MSRRRELGAERCTASMLMGMTPRWDSRSGSRKARHRSCLVGAQSRAEARGACLTQGSMRKDGRGHGNDHQYSQHRRGPIVAKHTKKNKWNSM
jgi:hypothetical protein